MKRITAWLALLTGMAALFFFGFLPGIAERSMNRVTGPQPPAATARAVALHETLVIADMHADTLLWSRDFLMQGTRGQVDLPRLKQGHVALQILSSVTKTPKGQNFDGNGADTDNITLLTVAQGQPVRTWGSLLERSLWHAEKLRRFEAGSGGRLTIVRTRTDLAALIAHRSVGLDVTGTVLSIEGLQNLEGKAANLDKLYDAGFRMAGLAHFFDNEVAGSMHGLKKGGLTPLGVQVVRAMEAKGMIVDIAHSSHATVAQVLAMATKPVVSSHGGVFATCEVNRNLNDDEIRGVARTGGVIGIGYFEGAVCDTSPAGIVRAIVHVRNLVGIDHVGLGSDYDGAVATRFDTTRLDAITQALIDAGISDADIAKVMGGNVLRVLAAALPSA
jgi:membrane dipeptidase